MKRRIIIIAAIFAASALLFLAGHGILNALDPDNTPPRPIDNASELYEKSIEQIRSAQDVVLSVKKEQKTTIGTETLLEVTDQSIAFNGLSTDNLRVSVDETLTIDEFQANFTEQYINGTGYITTGESRFSCPMEPEAYLCAFPPAVLLNAELYTNVSGIKTGRSFTLEFAEPSAIEHWIEGSDTMPANAHGTAYINENGQLTKSIYAFSYTQGAAQIEITYTTEVKIATEEIKEPENKDLYTPIKYLNALRVLERASGYLMQAENVTSHYHDNIYFQAFGDARTQDITLHTAQADGWSALVNTKTHLVNESRGEQSATLNKTELFSDNQYHSKTDDSQMTVNANIQFDDMYAYCHNLLVGNIMLPQYITGAELKQEDGKIRITFTANEEFAKLVSSNACNTLYQNPNLLSDLEKPGVTKKMQCYLDLDAELLLPIASGIDYVGAYTVEGISYTVLHKTEQTYDIPSQTALEEIKKAAES